MVQAFEWPECGVGRVSQHRAGRREVVPVVVFGAGVIAVAPGGTCSCCVSKRGEEARRSRAGTGRAAKVVCGF